MAYDEYCRYCGTQAKHHHHKFEKGMGASKKYKFMDNHINLADDSYLCTDCHRDTHAHPHEGKDLQMKVEAYLTFKKIFFKDYYNPYIIQKLLRYNPIQLRGLLKSMTPKGDQYASEDIILKLCGGSIDEKILAEVGE
jgi:hypothetical protein